MDIICEWARKYRDEVRDRLAQNIDPSQLSGMFRSQSWEDYLDVVGHSAKKLRTTSHIRMDFARIQRPNEPILPSCSSSPSERDVSFSSPEERKYGPSVDYHVDVSRGTGKDSILTTVRRIDESLYRLRFTKLPEGAEALESCLNILLPRLATTEAAGRLLELLETTQIFLRGEAFDELERLWIGNRTSPCNQANFLPLQSTYCVLNFLPETQLATCSPDYLCSLLARSRVVAQTTSHSKGI